MKSEELRAWFKERGIPMLPADHPIYSQGPSITFRSSSSVTNSHQPKPKSLDTFLEENPPGSSTIIFEVLERGRLKFQGSSDEINEEEVPEETFASYRDDEEECTDYDPPSVDSAFLFWRDDGLDPAEFGIVLVEGDVPGSDYIAAELRETVAYANAAAERLGVPIRFV
jgi:hypothetical protein